MAIKAFRICCFLLLLACGLLQLKFSVQEQRIFSDQKGLVATDQIRNARLLTYHAKQKYMFEADMSAATSLLQRALITTPYYVPAWLSLAELKNDIGEKKQAAEVLQYADLLTQGLKRWRWDKALVAYQLGKTDMLPDELSYIIKEIPGKPRADALQLAFTLWQEPEDLIRNIGHENIMHLFNYCVRKKFPQKSLFFWQMIESEGVDWQEKQAFAFLNMLLGTGEVQEAGNIWRSHFNSQNIVYNGNFSKNFLQRAFGWRGRKDKGFVQGFDQVPGEASLRNLHYRFKGWANLNFSHLYQVVPIESGKEYELSAEFKSQKLTTDQRPFLEVYGYKCKMVYAKSEMVDPDQEWTERKINFSVPGECDAVVIRLRRNESRHIDNKLAGKIWLRKFVIRETGESFKTPDEASNQIQLRNIIVVEKDENFVMHGESSQ